MGIRVGGYVAEEPIATGATAAVWRGTAPDGTPVAIKVFDGAPGDGLRLARREAALAAGVDHPHVVRVLDVVAENDVVGLVTVLAGGGSLADLLARRGSLTAAETLTVLLPIASALATAHERGVLHGDVAPSNIVFDVDGRPLLADLGAARAAVELATPVAATPTHVAPEVAKGGAPTPAADLFALGAVALHCLTGRPAWAADDLRDVVVQSTVGQWPDPDDAAAPAALVRVIRALLDVDPTRRPGGASVVVDLRRCGAPAPVDLARNLVPPNHVTPNQLARQPTRPATVVRVDPTGFDIDDEDVIATVPSRPPGPAQSRGAHRLQPGGRRRGLLVGVVVVVAAAAAVAGGLWWATWDRTAPTSAGQVTTAPTTAQTAAHTTAQTSPATPRTTARVAAPVTAPVTASTTTESTTATPPDTDWLATVASLDEVRASALRVRDPALLDDVYLSKAPARDVDEKVIAGLLDRGLVVADARHSVYSARRLTNSGSVIRVEVVDSMPSYAVSDESGAEVGRTAERAKERRIIELRSTPDGYRIAGITDA